MEETGDFVHKTVWHMKDVGRRGRSTRERKNINDLKQLVPVPSIGLRTAPTRTCSVLHHERRRFMFSQLPATDSGGVQILPPCFLRASTTLGPNRCIPIFAFGCILIRRACDSQLFQYAIPVIISETHFWRISNRKLQKTCLSAAARVLLPGSPSVRTQKNRHRIVPRKENGERKSRKMFRAIQILLKLYNNGHFTRRPKITSARLIC